MMYWIEYTDGTTKVFEAKDDADARHYFMMEGDHAYNYGLVNKIQNTISKNYSIKYKLSPNCS